LNIQADANVFHTFTVYLVYLKQILRYSSLAYMSA